MASNYEKFWNHKRYAVVGNFKARGFPTLTFNGLRAKGKSVYAVDPTVKQIGDQKTYRDFASLPKMVDAAVLEVPKEETATWVGRAAKAGIGRVWIHQGTETQDALDIATDHGLQVLHGTCAVMYLTEGFSYHTIHKVLWKALRKY